MSHDTYRFCFKACCARHKHFLMSHDTHYKYKTELNSKSIDHDNKINNKIIIVVSMALRCKHKLDAKH